LRLAHLWRRKDTLILQFVLHPVLLNQEATNNSGGQHQGIRQGPRPIMKVANCRISCSQDQSTKPIGAVFLFPCPCHLHFPCPSLFPCLLLGLGSTKGSWCHALNCLESEYRRAHCNLQGSGCRIQTHNLLHPCGKSCGHTRHLSRSHVHNSGIA